MSGEKHPMRYRPDIDGLRAVAVLAVVLYHAEIVPLHAGYMGVDVFFVISGFLITGILLQDASILRFYQRRARRILPALFAMLATVLAVGLILFLPHDLTVLARTVAATLAFGSNLLFWRMSSYFAHETQLWPLLHTWSLGVEEQFYIAFPLLIGAMRLLRVPQRRMAALFAILGLLSFAAAEYAVSHRNATLAFYQSPLRAWELLVGSVLATGAVPSSTRTWLRSLVGVAALAAIVVPMVLFSSISHFPGLSAMPAVLGATALIWAGSGGPHPVSRLLSARPVIFVGLISYSLYLWHWPVLAFARYYVIEPLNWRQAAGAVAGTFVLATLSWRFVERPLRRASVSDRKVWLISAGGMIALLVVSVGLIWTEGLPKRFPVSVAKLNGAADSTWRCPLTSFVRFGNGLACPLGAAGSNGRNAEVVLWGDSHAQMYGLAVGKALGERHGLLVTAYGCAPVAGDATTAACGVVQRANLAAIVASSAKTVILVQSWGQSRDEGSVQLGRALSSRERYAKGTRRLVDVVAALRRADKRVLLVSPIAVPGYDVAGVGSRELLFYGKIKHPTSIPLAAYQAETANIRAAMARLGQDPGVGIVQVDRNTCDDRRCYFVIGGRPIFADHDHLTTSYSAQLWPSFRIALASVSDVLRAK